MNTWQQHVIKQIVPSGQLMVVFDPHGLFYDESIQAELTSIGYSVYMYVDAATFRYDFEATIKPSVAQNRNLYILIIVPFTQSMQTHLPFVLTHRQECVEISFAHLYPMLHPQPLSELTPAELQRLWPHGYQQRQMLDITQTRTYILKQIYGLYDDQIQSIEDAVALVCQVHDKKHRLPPGIIAQLTQHPIIQRFREIPFTLYLESSTHFFDYLHQQWQSAAHRYLPSHPVNTVTATLDFSHQQLRLFIITFFQNQMLSPIEVITDSSIALPDWVAVGIIPNLVAFRHQAATHLETQISTHIPSDGAHYGEWLEYAQQYAHYVNLMAEVGNEEALPWQLTANGQFYAWLQSKYHLLHSLPPHNPVMVHHIAHYLRRLHTLNPEQRIALLVIDGMGLSQWRIVQRHLTQQLPQATIKEQSVFAWIPTLTTISRQAIFAGKPPIQFAENITTSSSEKRLWQQFWSDIAPAHVGYAKSLGTGNPHEDIDQIVSTPHMRVLGLVIDSIDEIMHGATLGMQGFQQQVHLWSTNGYLAGVLQALFDRGFEVCITSDHGNCLATGTGVKHQGSLVEKKSARALIYNNGTLREAFKSGYTVPTYAWPQIQLPDDYCALLATEFNAFVPMNQRIICHGGASLSEVIVPFVHIRQDKSS